jgi:hypothetical protein
MTAAKMSRAVLAHLLAARAPDRVPARLRRDWRR